MKVSLIGNCIELKSLVRPLMVEGCEINQPTSDLVLTDDLGLKTDIPKFFVGESSVPPQMAEALGYTLVEPTTSDYIVVKLFDCRDWLMGTAFGVPVWGMMNLNLGASICSALTLRSVQSERADLHFTEELKSTLAEMNYRGPVTLRMNDGGVVGIWHGIPFFGLYNMLELVRGKLSEWFVSPAALLDYWTVGLQVTRHPFPSVLKMVEYEVEGLSAQMEKHFWVSHPTSQRKAVYTTSTRVGVATSWSRTLLEAERRCLWTASNLAISEKQYRSDLTRTTTPIWVRLGFDL